MLLFMLTGYHTQGKTFWKSWDFKWERKEENPKSYFISSELLQLSIEICSVSFVLVFVFNDSTSSPHSLCPEEIASEY